MKYCERQKCLDEDRAESSSFNRIKKVWQGSRV